MCEHSLGEYTFPHSGTDRAFLLGEGVGRDFHLVKTLPNSVTDRVSVICIFFKIMMIMIAIILIMVYSK